MNIITNNQPSWKLRDAITLSQDLAPLNWSSEQDEEVMKAIEARFEVAESAYHAPLAP